MFKWIGKASNYTSNNRGIALTKRNLVNLVTPRTTQQWGGTLSQIGNLIVITGELVAGDISGSARMTSAVIADFVIGLPGKVDIEVESARYSTGAALLTYFFDILRHTQIVGSNTALKNIITVQMGIWAIGVSRWPIDALGKICIPYAPRFGKGVRNIAKNIKVAVSAVNFVLRPFLLMTSTDSSIWMFAGQAFGSAADIMYMDLIRRNPAVEPLSLRDACAELNQPKPEIIATPVQPGKPLQCDSLVAKAVAGGRFPKF